MMRAFACLVVLLSSVALLPGLENSMVLRASGTNGTDTYALVEPGLGNVTLYQVNGNAVNRLGSANFLADIGKLATFPAAVRNGITYTMLRVGANVLPSPADLLAAFPDQQTPLELRNHLHAYQQRAVEAEDQFWAQPHPYNGVVRGAMGQTMLMLCIPCMHALLFYDTTNVQQLGLIGWRNYGPDLMIPQIFHSNPAPQEILAQLPPSIQGAKKQEIEHAMQAIAAHGGALTLAESDPWATCGSGDHFAIVDQPNHHILTYDYSGKSITLVSSRSIDIDQLIPTAFGTNTPDEATEYSAYIQSRRELLSAHGILPDLFYFKALVQQQQVESSKTSDLQAAISADDLVLDFVRLHKFYVYRLIGANNELELVSMRDYTLDIGLTLQDQRFQQEADARSAAQRMHDSLAHHDVASALQFFRMALHLDPCIYPDIEKDPRTKDLRDLPDWQPAIDEATRACQDKLKALQDLARAAAAARAAAGGP